MVSVGSQPGGQQHLHTHKHQLIIGGQLAELEVVRSVLLPCSLDSSVLPSNESRHKSLNSNRPTFVLPGLAEVMMCAVPKRQSIVEHENLDCFFGTRLSTAPCQVKKHTVEEKEIGTSSNRHHSHTNKAMIPVQLSKSFPYVYDVNQVWSIFQQLEGNWVGQIHLGMVLLLNCWLFLFLVGYGYRWFFAVP